MRAPLAAIAALTLAAAACGSATPSRELVNARQAYNNAAQSRAAEYTPASVLSARQALDRAERAYDDDPGSDKERSYAYVAQRKAERAMIEGDAAYQRSQKDRADREYAELKNEMDMRTRAQLEATQDQLRSQTEEMKRLQEYGQVTEDERGTVLTLSGQVLFETGKATLTQPARDALTRVAQALAKGNQPITVEGHTDSRGSEEKNQELSMQRAETVRNFLVQQGVKPERITALGQGEANAIASNDTSEGRATNRRVEIVLGRMTPAAGRRPSEAPPNAPQSPQSPQSPQQHHQR
jgi:outer membrane protein OmpA-like peptidoglycan-associated protein